MAIIQKLAPILEGELKKADEIWIAVALITNGGLRFIHENIPKDCKQNFLIGVDLPTDPKALKKLNELELLANHYTGLITQKEFYHPKVYLLRQNKKYLAFLGSANCTSGGLRNNIEISIKIDNQSICKELLDWFKDQQTVAIPISKSFIDHYLKGYELRIKRKQEDERYARKEKVNLNKEFELTLTERNELLKALKKYRGAKDYNIIKLGRAKVIKELRTTLDYPKFNNIDIDAFFNIWELGHIIPLPKPTIKREIKKFSRLIKMLCDESKDIAVRYNRALDGDLKIRGVGEGLISKVLTIHSPALYFVNNDKSRLALKKYGVQLPRGLSKGDKYKILCHSLKQICKDTNIDDLAVLDNYLYLEGNK